MPDQVCDKKTIGIPDDVILILAEIQDLRDEVAALAGEAKWIVADAAKAEEQRKKNEHIRQMNEYVRQQTYKLLLELVGEMRKEHLMMFQALDALGALHDDHDYMVLVHGLHLSDRVATFSDGVLTMDGVFSDGGLLVDGVFYGLEA